ncbi:hypothetical protein HG15A2_11880 [Adhaeretor mobilis]|uniref:Uncharacterized protein n=1 Tax=Adhaeretor mobilis TaxID=1930276 RepID=A0A517MSQ7_9BACT|nr:hypothetical protein HG15A2_11880 [Adhaeretor mobilis]
MVEGVIITTQNIPLMRFAKKSVPLACLGNNFASGPKTSKKGVSDVSIGCFEGPRVPLSGESSSQKTESTSLATAYSQKFANNCDLRRRS